jgi:hypothetical protein
VPKPIPLKHSNTTISIVNQSPCQDLEHPTPYPECKSRPLHTGHPVQSDDVYDHIKQAVQIWDSSFLPEVASFCDEAETNWNSMFMLHKEPTRAENLKLSILRIYDNMLLEIKE